MYNQVEGILRLMLESPSLQMLILDASFVKGAVRSLQLLGITGETMHGATADNPQHVKCRLHPLPGLQPMESG